MTATCRVLRYIKGTPDYGILLQASSDLQLSTYWDSDGELARLHDAP